MSNTTPAGLIFHACLWNNCSEIFASLPELAAHIATSHMSPLSSFQLNYQELARPYYPYYYYSQGLSSGIYPRVDKRFSQIYQTYNNLVYQPDLSQSTYYTPHAPYLYQNYTTPQNVQSRSPAETAIIALDNDELNSFNNALSLATNSATSTDQGSMLRGRYHTVESQNSLSISPSSSSLVVRSQNKTPQIGSNDSTQEKDDPPVQCFSHSKASSASAQRPQDQISSADLREEIEELRNLVKEQAKELHGKSHELSLKDEEIKKISDDNNEKSREIVKLKSLISLRDSEINLVKENLDLQTTITKLLQEQNRRADDKLRRMWAEMLCRKAYLSEEGLLNGHDDESSSKSSRKRYRDYDENSDLHPMEVPSPPQENISVITEALTCNWEDCGKTFRTKLALKAHFVSTHMNENILKVPVVNP